jgi:hypothetical protein
MNTSTVITPDKNSPMEYYNPLRIAMSDTGNDGKVSISNWSLMLIENRSIW